MILSLAAVGLISLIQTFVAEANEPPRSQLERALELQSQWLSGQRSAADWERYLLTAELQTELAKGEAANRHTVLKVLARYEAPQPGLKLPQFASTRRALADWAGELSQPSLAELPALARQVREQFKPVSKAEVLAHQVAVDAALQRLDRYLRNSGLNGEGWRKYLHLAELQIEMQKGLSANAKLLDQIADFFVAGKAGLELAPFASAGAELQAYGDLLAAYQDPIAKQQYEQAIDKLVSDLEQAIEKPAEVDRVAMGETLGSIAVSGQAGQLVKAVRGQFAQPNLHVQVSRNIVTTGIEDHVDENTPISDVILGTDIAGNGQTRAVVTAALVPNTEQATIQLTLRGSTASKTVGRNGPATIFSSATTSLLGSKRIFINELGFGSDSAHALCCTRSHIDDICICGGFIIQRVATKRIYGSKSTGEAISAQHAEVRLETRMNTRTGGLLANVNWNYNKKFRNPLAQRGAFPSVFRFATTTDWLTVLGLQARSHELAAPVPPPAIADGSELSIRAHESLIDNMAAATMAGQIARDEDFKRLMRNFHGEDLNPDELAALMRNIGDGVEAYEDFASLFQDREEQVVSPQDFSALKAAIQQQQLSAQQFERFIHPLSKGPLTLEEANAMLLHLPEESLGSLMLAPSRPVSVRFRDGGFSITLRSTAHTSRTGVERNLPMNISATYKLERNGGTVIARRQGEIEVDPPDFKPGGRLDIQQTAARRTLRTRFEEILKPEFKSTGLQLRGRWKRLGNLPWTQLVLDRGWIAAGWKPADATAQANPELRTAETQSRPLNLEP
ncbi:MAG: hypothetical protein IT427_13940 [Pirellulales bacterium]|nr:hypothetical protein [Pirellulales bacterium]